MNRTPQDLDRVCAILMRLSSEYNALADQYEREGYRRDRTDQEAAALSCAAVLLMEDEVRVAQACDVISRLAFIAGLENDPETARLIAYLSDGSRVDPHLRRFKPKKLPLHFRIRARVTAFLLGASAVLGAYG